MYYVKAYFLKYGILLIYLFSEPKMTVSTSFQKKRRWSALEISGEGSCQHRSSARSSFVPQRHNAALARSTICISFGNHNAKTLIQYKAILLLQKSII